MHIKAAGTGEDTAMAADFPVYEKSGSGLCWIIMHCILKQPCNCCSISIDSGHWPMHNLKTRFCRLTTNHGDDAVQSFNLCFVPRVLVFTLWCLFNSFAAFLAFHSGSQPKEC